jgi:hypothetical protein
MNYLVGDFYGRLRGFSMKPEAQIDVYMVGIIEGGYAAFQWDIAMTTEPFEELEQALRDLASQSQRLEERIAQLHFYNKPEGNRRSRTPQGLCAPRRLGERRIPQRAAAGRRELADRRLPPRQRLAEWQSQLAQVLERSIELSQLKRRLQT